MRSAGGRPGGGDRPAGFGEVALPRDPGVAGGLDDLKELEKNVDWGDDDLSVYGRLAIEYGKRYMAMRRDWFDWAMREIRTIDERR
ncbi:hypothetical protein [Actinomadura monticuli]|uniref:Transcription regulator PadR C-terminal domain-containing protein n=1 Tax=Actinomadura monticuli TaxID=3097367 RepID=A0ABV4QA36_9ACTN